MSGKVTSRTITAFCLGVLTAITVLLLAIPAKAMPYVMCPSGHAGVALNSSCVVAEEVRVAFFTQPRNPVVGYNPDTKGLYAMNCTPEANIGGWLCRDARSAVVIWR